MWESLYNILFNPNHEMTPSSMLMVAAIVLVFSFAMQAYSRRRQNEQGLPPEQRSSKKKKKK